MPIDRDFRGPLPTECDVVVVGAGPAGLMAAHTLAKAKVGTIVLLDRRDPWREPVSCAEAVRQVPFRKVSPLPIEPWIRASVDHCLFASEHASFLWTTPGDGLIIDRARMHADLARACDREGAICHFRTRAISVTPLVDGRRTLELESEGQKLSLRARCVIDASGPGRGLGREEGLASGDADLETAAFSLVDGLSFDPNTIQLWYSQRFAPGGYAWLFPSGASRANVGVVCARGSGLSARAGLALFLDHLQPGKTTESVWGGAIPCGSGSGTLAHDMLFKAGDSASMVHPLSRAGIVEAMEAGTIAAQSAAAALSETTSAGKERHFRAYRKTWTRRRGLTYRAAQWIKPWFGGIPDQAWDTLFARLNRRPPTGHTWPHTAWEVLKIVPMTLRRKPSKVA